MTAIAIYAGAEPSLLETLEKALQGIKEAAVHVQFVVVRQRAALQFYFACRKLNNSVSNMLSALDSLTEAMHNGEGGNMVLSQAEENIDPQNALRIMEMMQQIIHSVYLLSKNAGFKSKMLTRPQVELLGSSSERLKDYLMWIREFVQPENLARADASFGEALREFQEGETVPFV